MISTSSAPIVPINMIDKSNMSRPIKQESTSAKIMRPAKRFILQIPPTRYPPIIPATRRLKPPAIESNSQSLIPLNPKATPAARDHSDATPPKIAIRLMPKVRFF